MACTMDRDRIKLNQYAEHLACKRRGLKSLRLPALGVPQMRISVPHRQLGQVTAATEGAVPGRRKQSYMLLYHVKILSSFSLALKRPTGRGVSQMRATYICINPGSNHDASPQAVAGHVDGLQPPPIGTDLTCLCPHHHADYHQL